ncbi:MAG: ferritin-like domain-containing protein [Actinobacteria bacterium]|nr:ferritin-like domain-containing protein [Actinomycetota bacterium]
MADDRELATVELLGALTYAQLRAFEVTARAVRVAPDARAADVVASFAVREFEAYRGLRDCLGDLTDLVDAVVSRQKARIDEYFDGVPTHEDWLSACTFFAAGLPLAGDFVSEIAPFLDAPTREVVLEALTRRESFVEYATAQVVEQVDTDPAIRDAARHLVADITGKALTQFQGAITDTDALEVLLGDEPDDRRVREVAMRVLDAHRRRMHALGVEDPE